MRNNRTLRAAALTAALLLVAAAVLWRPAAALWRRLARTPDAEGMYQVEGWWAEDLGETDVRSAENFAAKLQSLRAQYLTGEKVTPGRITAPAPTHTPAPMRTSALYCRPVGRSSGSMGWPAVAMVTWGPNFTQSPT